MDGTAIASVTLYSMYFGTFKCNISLAMLNLTFASSLRLVRDQIR